MSGDHGAVSGLGELVTRQVRSLAARSLRDVIDGPRALPAEIAAYLRAHRAELAAWARGLEAHRDGAEWSTNPAGFAAERWLTWLQLRNQFLALAPAAKRAALDVHRAAAQALTAAVASARDDATAQVEVERAWVEYQEALAQWLVRHLGDQPVEAVCAEYSAETQLRVLGVSLHDLREPVLDVGCGAEARLVAAMRERGLEAVGLDRHATGAHTIALDWDEYRFAPSSWGTILSHLAFSLHFVHRHVGVEAGPAQRMARKYMEVLQALQLGGSFVYAPSLPFIEDLLPRQLYQVRRLAVDAPALATRPGLELASTSWVTRLA